MSFLRGSKPRDALRLLAQRQLARDGTPPLAPHAPLKLTEVRLFSELTAPEIDPGAHLVFGVNHAPAGDLPSGDGAFSAAQVLLVESRPTDTDDDDFGAFDPSRLLGASDEEEEAGNETASPPLRMAAWEMAYDTWTDMPDEESGEDGDSIEPGVLSRGQTATVRFWAGARGQSLVRAFDGGPLATAFGDWLAATLPNLYGAESPNHVAGKPNTYVAALFRRLGRLEERSAAAQVLAAAFSMYATTATLGGAQAAPFGFLVTEFGVGESYCNVGPAGPAFGVQPNSSLTVLQLLQALDGNSPQGVLLRGEPRLLRHARWLLDLVNRFGGIDNEL